MHFDAAVEGLVEPLDEDPLEPRAGQDHADPARPLDDLAEAPKQLLNLGVAALQHRLEELVELVDAEDYPPNEPVGMGLKFLGQLLQGSSDRDRRVDASCQPVERDLVSSNIGKCFPNRGVRGVALEVAQDLVEEGAGQRIVAPVVYVGYVAKRRSRPSLAGVGIVR